MLAEGEPLHSHQDKEVVALGPQARQEAGVEAVRAWFSTPTCNPAHTSSRAKALLEAKQPTLFVSLLAQSCRRSIASFERCSTTVSAKLFLYRPPACGRYACREIDEHNSAPPPASRSRS